jgi:hypothetical protein
LHLTSVNQAAGSPRPELEEMMEIRAHRERHRKLIGVLCLFGLALGSFGCDDSDRRRIRVATNVFDANCSSCHGHIEAGEGPKVVPGTDLQAPDLRTLARRWGTLDRERIARFIDGRADVAAHGPRTMPVWGERLYSDWPASDNRELARAGTIELLVDYLESVQLE